MKIHHAIGYLAALLLVSGCMPAQDRPEPNVQLPGFDVWMPKGVVVKQGSHPAIGSYEVRSGTSIRLPAALKAWFPQRATSTKVSWRVETFMEGDQVDVSTLLDGAMRGAANNHKTIVGDDKPFLVAAACYRENLLKALCQCGLRLRSAQPCSPSLRHRD